MRRCSDDWVNATQILKAAKFPKAHRTRILEREVQTGIHEKIQGGYGRFQGTWIPLDIARPLAHKYNITDAMAPILSHVPDPKNPVPRKTKNVTNKMSSSTNNASTPNASLTASRQGTGSPGKKPKKVYNTKRRRAAAAAAAAAAAVANGSYDPNVNHQQLQTPPQSRHQQQQGLHPQHQPIPVQHVPNGMIQVGLWQHMNGYQQQVPQMANFANPHRQAVHYAQQQQQQHPLQHQQIAQQQHMQVFGQALQVPQQQMQQQTFPYQQHKTKISQETWSQDDASIHMDEVMRDSDTSISSNEEHSGYKRSKAIYMDALIQFFATDAEKIPQNLLNPPSDYDFNEPIDEEGHTPLHWAASIASIPLIELLLRHGADPLTPNATGLNCISRAIFFNNSYQKHNFHIIVNLMKNCLYTPDKAGRTPMHYLCESIRSKPETALYYLSAILDQLRMGNKDLLEIVVNHTDVNGDSAVSLALRAGNDALTTILEPYSNKKKVSVNNSDVEAVKDESPENEEEDDGDRVPPQQDNEEQDHPGSPLSSSLPKMPVKEVGPMLSSMLSSLADAYDTELKNKEEESSHTKTILDKLKQDIETTERQNRDILVQIEEGISLDELLNNIGELEAVFNKKSAHLGKVLERSQALELAQAVLSEENSITDPVVAGDAVALGIELTRLQMDRTKVVNDIMEALTKQNISKKMNNYRRLISLACDIKLESVDELIDEIEADLLTTVE